jgi:carbon monoxide dehydrogenase subunit G
MVRIEGEIAINRPVEEVVDFVADERNEPRYNPRIERVEKLTAGPIGQGTRFQAQTRIVMGRPLGIAIQYTACERPRRLASIQMAATEIQGTLSFDPVAGGTRMRWSWDMQLRGLFRLLTPVIASTGRRQERATWAGLKQFMEGRRDPVGEAR